MKVSDLIDRLVFLRQVHGELDVLLDIDCGGLLEIGEVDVDAENTGIIIWKADE